MGNYTYNVWSPTGVRYLHGCNATTAASWVSRMPPGFTVQRGKVVLYEQGEAEVATPELLEQRAARATYPHVLSIRNRRDKPWQQDEGQSARWHR